VGLLAGVVAAADLLMFEVEVGVAMPPFGAVIVGVRMPRAREGGGRRGLGGDPWGRGCPS
jgi:hypothetical protein